MRGGTKAKMRMALLISSMATSGWDTITKKASRKRYFQSVMPGKVLGVEMLQVAYVKKRDLGGVFAWAADLDDFKGLCGSKFPLLSSINKQLKGTLGFHLKQPWNVFFFRESLSIFADWSEQPNQTIRDLWIWRLLQWSQKLRRLLRV